MSYAGICEEKHNEQSKDQIKTSEGRRRILGVETVELRTSGDIELPGAGGTM